MKSMTGRQGKRKASMVILAIFVSILLIGQSITLAYAGDESSGWNRA